MVAKIFSRVLFWSLYIFSFYFYDPSSINIFMGSILQPQTDTWILHHLFFEKTIPFPMHSFGSSVKNQLTMSIDLFQIPLFDTFDVFIIVLINISSASHCLKIKQCKSFLKFCFQNCYGLSKSYFFPINLIHFVNSLEAKNKQTKKPLGSFVGIK